MSLALERDKGRRTWSCEVLASPLSVVAGKLVVCYFPKYKQQFLVIIWHKNSPGTQTPLYTEASEI